MTKHSAPAPVRHSVVVEAPIAHAFKVFTQDFGSFKPREHNLLAVPISETIFEPRVGGHVYDRGVDGSECHWARVLAYDPPNRLLLSWDISPRWQVEADPNRTSEWEVRFTAETENRTRVEIEHRNLERHGEGWEGVRGGVDSDQGWPLYLQRFHDLFPHRVA
ncbi:SRPBCC family protein [Mesorhizobium sp. B1-1-8]|uniref:SRPBCC family protein n=1 Tax=Mesorhizobium sp. B1-1-8 TaxID=2589976 RepID=UPI0011282E89|nr:SRPBCC family protein [Mesorhizobium sp. B1-1-8]UCI06449.1 SRPBCC family protein [Mesorhizobium sp. B1-1-8]